MIFAPSKDSDQPGHPASLNIVFDVRKDPNFPNADSENSDQIGRMPMLILVFAWRTCHFLSFFLSLFFLSFFLSFFDAMYICISLNYAVIEQVLSWKQCISFFLSFH